MPFFTTLAAIVIIYSIAVIVLVMGYHRIKRRRGISGVAETINRNFVGRQAPIVAFEIFSFVSIMAWFWLALQGVWSMVHYTIGDGGFKTYFGWVTSRQAEIYFLIVLFGGASMKAAISLIELAGLIRKGRVSVTVKKGFYVWESE